MAGIVVVELLVSLVETTAVILLVLNDVDTSTVYFVDVVAAKYNFLDHLLKSCT